MEKEELAKMRSDYIKEGLIPNPELPCKMCGNKMISGNGGLGLKCYACGEWQNENPIKKDYSNNKVQSKFMFPALWNVDLFIKNPPKKLVRNTIKSYKRLYKYNYIDSDEYYSKIKHLKTLL